MLNARCYLNLALDLSLVWRCFRNRRLPGRAQQYEVLPPASSCGEYSEHTAPAESSEQEAGEEVGVVWEEVEKGKGRGHGGRDIDR